MPRAKAKNAGSKLRKFRVRLVREVKMTVDQRVIDQGLRDDNPILGKGASENDVLEHLAHNLVSNDITLSQIDGYANMKDEQASVDDPETVIEVDEIVPIMPVVPRRRR